MSYFARGEAGMVAQAHSKAIDYFLHILLIGLGPVAVMSPSL